MTLKGVAPHPPSEAMLSRAIIEAYPAVRDVCDVAVIVLLLRLMSHPSFCWINHAQPAEAMRTLPPSTRRLDEPGSR